MRIEKSLKEIAEAFVSIVEENKAVSVVQAELIKLNALLSKTPYLRQFLFSEKINTGLKKSTIKSTLGQEFSPFSLGIIYTIIELKEERKIFKLIAYIGRLLEKREARFTAQVLTPFPLSEEAKRLILSFIAEVESQEVELKEHLDESLVAGIVIKVGDKLYDGSVKGRLGRFRKAVLERI